MSFASFPLRSGRRHASLLLALTAISSAPLAAQTLYWTAVNTYPSFAVRTSDTSFSDVQDIQKDIPDDVLGLAADPEKGLLYWVERSATVTRIVRSGLDGKGVKPVYTSEDYPARLALDTTTGRLYFTASRKGGGGGVIASFQTPDPGAEGQLEATVLLEADVDDIAVDGPGGKLYWVREGRPGLYGTDIWSGDLEAQNATPIIHHEFEHHTTGIAIDSVEKKIYWATVDYRGNHGQIVSRASLDGTDEEPITSANPGLDDWPVFLDIDRAHRELYWVNGEDGKFFKVALDGGEAQFVHEDTGDFGPFDLIILASGDEPGPSVFRRGDADGNGDLNIADPIFVLGSLFLGTQELPCNDAADANDDGRLDIADAISSLAYQFLGTFQMPAPGPSDCGQDPTATDDLDCAVKPPCGG